MRNKLLPIIAAVIFLAAGLTYFFLMRQKTESIDTVKLNDLKNEIEKSVDYSDINSDYKVTIIDFFGNVLYSNCGMLDEKKSYAEWLNSAYKNGDIILDFDDGKIFVFKGKSNLTDFVTLTVLLFSVGLIIILILYQIYIEKNFFMPFKKLKGFAADIAQGDFEKPLPMDKKNLFGAFSESFDIMREELKRLKEKEIQLERSKKELMAELGHDIKTPVSTIRAVLEVLKISKKTKDKLESIETIRQKAVEIDNLITDMFTAALDDLSALKVNIGIISSKEVGAIIDNADHLKKVSTYKIPDCLIKTDPLRLRQVIGNIVNNSYKYAGTKIEISSKIDDGFLEIKFKDFGKGVLEEELPLILNKFYRGKNSENSSGAGLGLYICKNILEKTEGKIDCYNDINGFAVEISLKLA